MQECGGGGGALGDSDTISASVMCGTDPQHMAASTLAHSHRLMEADETRHASGCRALPAGPRPAYVCTPACAWVSSRGDGCLSFYNTDLPARWPLSPSCCLPHLQMSAN